MFTTTNGFPMGEFFLDIQQGMAKLGWVGGLDWSPVPYVDAMGSIFRQNKQVLHLAFSGKLLDQGYQSSLIQRTMREVAQHQLELFCPEETTSLRCFILREQDSIELDRSGSYRILSQRNTNA